MTSLTQKRFFLTSVVIFAGVVGFLVVKKRQEVVLPLTKIETVAKIVVDAKKFRNSKIGAPDSIDFEGWPKLRPVFVSSSGQIDLMSNDGEIISFDETGKRTRRIRCSWVNCVALLQKSNDSFWAIDLLSLSDREFYSCLTKTNARGQGLWKIGQGQIGIYHGNKFSQKWQRPPSQKGADKPVQLPYRFSANPQDPTADQFEEPVDLSVSKNGDVFVLTKDAVMRRFNPNGRLLERYLLKDKGSQGADFIPRRDHQGFSALVAPDGSIYCHPFALQDKENAGLQLPLDHWTSPTRHTTRLIDLSPLGKIFSKQVRLMAIDSAGNLYFQYRFQKSSEIDYENGEVHWEPTGIAKVSKNGIARQIFSIENHYGEEMRQARLRAGTMGTWSNIGVGDLLHVSDKGELFLEIANDTHYRIDKISFPKTPK